MNEPDYFQHLEQFLLSVERPGRYIGREINAVTRQISAKGVSWALCFPDTYEIGMSHLGLKILYEILNQQPDVRAERCFAPWLDMERVLRDNHIPLLTLEGRRPLRDCDIVGFSLQYELSYTNVLNMLELGGIPVHAAPRNGLPLVLAGGACVLNPEPLSDFIDAFLIGEAEEAVLEITEIVRRYTARGERGPCAREALLADLRKCPGVYVPRFYTRAAPARGGRALVPAHPAAPAVISRRAVQDFEHAPLPVRPVVPSVGIVHDRINIEIMRGCPNRCLFCQAGFAINPLRVRSVARITDACRESYRATGYDTVALSSLSTANYPHLAELLHSVGDFCRRYTLAIAVPSLRVGPELFEVVGVVGSLKKTGLTFAPEAGSERLRRMLNKTIDLEQLKQAALAAYRRGWQRLKLYFMIGLPTETDADLLEIVALVQELSALRRQVSGRPGKISVSISNFIPKPHTPAQWASMLAPAELQRRQAFIRARLSPKIAEVDTHDPRLSFLEALLARSDRRAGSLIYAAFAAGARFDGWASVCKFDVWQQAIAGAGLAAETGVGQARDLSAALPWNHIDCGVPAELLARYARNSGIVSDPHGDAGQAAAAPLT
ncbi:MAG: TIGR03960 family B12-binding radical SAM protein [Candidatus Omnitrophica bacterium]|nr:TIGR03960 family B12-binding radical SAM protein [Candidatus Omnitrophota bacterium]